MNLWFRILFVDPWASAVGVVGAVLLSVFLTGNWL